MAAGLICSLTTAESSGSSIMQHPQWPVQLRSVASQERARGREGGEERHTQSVGQREATCASTRENTSAAAVNGSCHVQN